MFEYKLETKSPETWRLQISLFSALENSHGRTSFRAADTIKKACAKTLEDVLEKANCGPSDDWKSRCNRCLSTQEKPILKPFNKLYRSD